MINRRTLLAGLSALPFLPSTAQASARAPSSYLITRWSEDPWAYGSYSHMAKGATPEDRLTLAEPVAQKLFFAGEACSPYYPSTVHGALRSGNTAALVAMSSIGGGKKIAVIGAGFAGLWAARAYSDIGDAVVFEARDRVGGRVWTSDTLGTPLDLGASWIHGTKNNVLTDLADRLGVKRLESDYENGVFIDSNGRNRRVEPGWMEDAWVRQSYGADADWLSPEAYTEGWDSFGGDVVFEQGYAGLLPALEGDYELLLNTPVREIDWTDGVTINGTEKFDAVIVTVPLGVLKKGLISFTPALPEEKQQAIDKLGFGVLDKLYLKFDEVFWDKDVEWLTYATDEPNEYPSWLNFYKLTGQPILMAFAGGSNALKRAAKSDTEILRGAEAALSDMYPT